MEIGTFILLTKTKIVLVSLMISFLLLNYNYTKILTIITITKNGHYCQNKIKTTIINMIITVNISFIIIFILFINYKL